MDTNTGPKPSFLKRAGVRLAHFETGPANPRTPPLVLVNGWTGDHRIFTPQIAHFGQTRRVVAINLRGHGDSDAPKQDYTLAGFADDIAWQGKAETSSLVEAVRVAARIVSGRRATEPPSPA